MVRLKVAASGANPAVEAGFQFQNGAIKSSEAVKNGYVLLCFNSKMVRLKAYMKNPINKGVKSFNSKMVRLKAWSIRLQSASMLCFNSKMVRLKVEWRTQYGFASAVSIPKWCD